MHCFVHCYPISTAIYFSISYGPSTKWGTSSSLIRPSLLSPRLFEGRHERHVVLLVSWSLFLRYNLKPEQMLRSLKQAPMVPCGLKLLCHLTPALFSSFLLRGLNWQSCLPPCPSASKLIVTTASQFLEVPWTWTLPSTPLRLCNFLSQTSIISEHSDHFIVDPQRYAKDTKKAASSRCLLRHLR